MDLFEYIVKRNESIDIGEGFKRIYQKEDYNELFDGLIESKVQKEMEAK
jgi:hypothetical protein